MRTKFKRPWDNIKYTNIYLIGVPKGEERKKMKIYLKK